MSPRKLAPLAALGLSLLAAPASASATASLPIVSASNPAAACVEQPTTQAFLKFKDLADYSLAPSGDFETALKGWTLTNAKVVAGNETAGVLPGTRSLLLGASLSGGAAEAISPEFCITEDHPTFRFLTKNIATGKSRLKTELVYRTLEDLDDIDDKTADIVYQESQMWAPSAINPLATELTESKLREGVLMRISFQVSSSVVKKGGVQIDNLLIDPYRRG